MKEKVKKEGFRHPEFITESGFSIGRVEDCDATAMENALTVANALGVNAFMPRVDSDGDLYAQVSLGEFSPREFESIRFYGGGIILREVCHVRDTTSYCELWTIPETEIKGE